MIKIELSFTTIAEAVAFLSAGQSATGYTLGTGVLPVPAKSLVGSAIAQALATKLDGEMVKAAADGQKKPKAVAADPTPATTPVATPAASSPTAAAAVADAPDTKATVSEKQYIFSDADGYSKDPTYANEVSPKIANTVKLGMPQRDAVVALLAKYGVKRGNFVPHAKWPQFTADLDAIAATAV